MRRLIIVAALAALAAAGPARADVTGHIHIGNPTSDDAGGITELLGECDPASDVQGLDGFWVAVPASGGQTFTATPTGDAAAANDLALAFYTAACEYISVGDDEGPGVAETQIAPEGTAFVSVNLWLGAMADFTLAIA